MKNINLLISLLCVLFCACSESNDDDSNTPLGQLSVTLKDANGKPVKDAFVVLSGLEGRRLVNMGEGFSKENGSWLPYYKGNVDGYISVVASGYEAPKQKCHTMVSMSKNWISLCKNLIHLASCLIMLKMDSKTKITRNSASSNGYKDMIRISCYFRN